MKVKSSSGRVASKKSRPTPGPGAYESADCFAANNQGGSGLLSTVKRFHNPAQISTQVPEPGAYDVTVGTIAAGNPRMANLPSSAFRSAPRVKGTTSFGAVEDFMPHRSLGSTLGVPTASVQQSRASNPGKFFWGLGNAAGVYCLN